MSNALQKFQFHTFQLEVIDKDDEMWFIAAPLAQFLEYQNPAEAIRTNVDEEDIDKIYIPTKSNNYVCVNESGLYSLIFRSNKPEAKAFKRWVTKEVLPTIRKKGVYADTEQHLTTCTPEQIYTNLLALATEMRAKYSHLNISDENVLQTNKYAPAKLY
jgi:anti-repressor protein